MKAAERIQEVMTAPFKLSELEISVECAIGLALMQEGQDAEELFRNAQFAVKQAKASRQAAGLRAQGGQRRRGGASRSRPNFAARSTRTS